MRDLPLVSPVPTQQHTSACGTDSNKAHQSLPKWDTTQNQAHEKSSATSKTMLRTWLYITKLRSRERQHVCLETHESVALLVRRQCRSIPGPTGRSKLFNWEPIHNGKASQEAPSFINAKKVFWIVYEHGRFNSQSVKLFRSTVFLTKIWFIFEDFLIKPMTIHQYLKFLCWTVCSPFLDGKKKSSDKLLSFSKYLKRKV